VFHDPTLDEILFIANGAFRVRTQYTTHDNTTCPFEFNFDVNLAKLGATKNKNGELQLTIDESTNTTTKMLDLRFNQTSDKYFMERVLIHYSENTFIQNGSIEVISIGAFNLLAYPTPTGDSYSCDYAAEVQLNNTNNAEYGFIIKPAMWQGYSTFSQNQTTISNPDECDFDKVPDNSEHVSWDLYSKNGQTQCGRVEMNGLLHIDYTTVMAETKSRLFSIPKDTKILYDFHNSPKDPSTCQDLAHNQSFAITWPIEELGQNVVNLSLTFDSEDGHNWLVSRTEISVLFGKNPLFPNSNITKSMIGSVASLEALKFIQADMNAAFRCDCLADKWKMDCEHYRLPVGHINITDTESHYVGLMLYNLTIQPTNIGPNSTYGNFEYCAGDQRGSMVGFWIAVGLFSTLTVTLVFIGVYETSYNKQEQDGGVLVIDNKNFDLIGDTEPQVIIYAEADEPKQSRKMSITKAEEGDNPNFTKKSSSAPNTD